jgi:hypothetical protein
MPRRTLSLTPVQERELIDHRDHDLRPDIRERCAALLKIAAGHAPHAVARHGLLKPRDPDTVYHWLDRYQADGLDGLTTHRHGGNRHRPFRPRRRVGRPPTAGPR